MKFAVLAFGLAGLSLAAFATPRLASGAQQPSPVPTCPNPLPHEPLVVYEVTGGTLAGSVDSLLAVYSDGLARYSSSLGSGPGFGFTVQVGPAAAAQLHAELVQSGALRACDEDDFTSDVPLSTLTVLRGTSKQIGNTFSWLDAEGGTVAIEALLLDFIAIHFPAAPAGG